MVRAGAATGLDFISAEDGEKINVWLNVLPVLFIFIYLFIIQNTTDCDKWVDHGLTFYHKPFSIVLLIYMVRCDTLFLQRCFLSI